MASSSHRPASDLARAVLVALWLLPSAVLAQLQPQPSASVPSATPGAGTPALAAPLPDCASLTTQQLLDRTDDLFRGTSSHARLTMKVVTEHWSRELKLEAWSQGTRHSLVKILAPQKERGTATLMVEANIWNYLPKVARTIKVPSSMMGGSWMGSHVTNDDLVKQSRMADDFTSARTFLGDREGRRIIEVTCTPKPEAAVVWGKVVVELDASTCLATRLRYFDEDRKLARTMTLSEVQTLSGRTLPTLMRVIPEDKPGELTEVRYDELTFDVALPADLFTLRSLER